MSSEAGVYIELARAPHRTAYRSSSNDVSRWQQASTAHIAAGRMRTAHRTAPLRIASPPSPRPPTTLAIDYCFATTVKSDTVRTCIHIDIADTLIKQKHHSLKDYL